LSGAELSEYSSSSFSYLSKISGPDVLASDSVLQLFPGTIGATGPIELSGEVVFIVVLLSSLLSTLLNGDPSLRLKGMGFETEGIDGVSTM
jgi:hypothetical protein